MKFLHFQTAETPNIPIQDLNYFSVILMKLV